MSNEKAHGEVINIASGKPIKIRKVVELIQKFIGRGTPMFGDIQYRKKENMALYANTSKAKRILKWEAVTSIEKGIALMLKDINNS